MHVVTPTGRTIWEGTPAETSRYTVQQLRTIAAERPNWIRFSDHIVKLTYPSVLQWGEPTIVEVPCPIIAWTKDGKRRLIVAPAGDKIWVDRD